MCNLILVKTLMVEKEKCNKEIMFEEKKRVLHTEERGPPLGPPHQTVIHSFLSRLRGLRGITSSVGIVCLSCLKKHPYLLDEPPILLLKH
jgi:hypothetical protein